MKTVTLFSWGYRGWGTSTPQLIEIVDAIERERGFSPPIFVDVRIRREVRAPGFSGAAFEKLIGKDRYLWMRSLGNRSIRTGEDEIVIDEPESANELLQLALDNLAKRRRVIFFCSCERAKEEGEVRCHRVNVGDLVLAAAVKRGIAAEIVEWPGGVRINLEIPVEKALFRSIEKGRLNIPLPASMDPVALGGPPWASLATFQCEGQSIHRLVGPIRWREGGWSLSVVRWSENPDMPLKMYRDESDRLLDARGWAARQTAGLVQIKGTLRCSDP